MRQHVIHVIYEDFETDGIILLDAFKYLCHPLYKFLINTYHNDTVLFIIIEMLWSKEGTTQGDPL